MGNPEQADESFLPQWHYLAEPGWAVIKGNDAKAMMEAQQRIADSMPNAQTIDIRADAPHLAMRKLVQQALDAERAAK
jgi:hypothetical protein